ncbi:hypothetical protein ACH4FX_12140 [Streptomyces sp. NPDC018019]|uniref:hypothetical protein n=1 Tax=Streptomyces sp. NPDC018019 TaxID=3365030 RepID=UPI003796DF4C
MSYINIHAVQAINGSDITAELGLDPEPDHSLRDGEEIVACARILDLLGDLNNGEALVITRELS